MTLRVGVEEVRQECNGGHETKCNWEHEKSREDGRGWGTWLLGLLQCVWHLLECIFGHWS